MENPLATLQTAARRFAENPGDAQAAAHVRQLRFQMAHAALTVADDLFPSAAHNIILPAMATFIQSGIYGLILEPQEEQFTQQAQHLLATGTPAHQARALLALMSYRRAYQLPLLGSFDFVAPGMLDEIMRYLLAVPQVFERLGDVDRWLVFLDHCADVVLRGATERQNEGDRAVAKAFATHLNCIPLYFTAANLKHIAVKRARIMQEVVRAQGRSLDYDFGPRPKDRRIRVGVLNIDWLERTETYATLSVFEHLDRQKFDVFLYASVASGRNFEQRCIRAATRFTALAGGVDEQLKTIRADDLDFLLVGANLLAVTRSLTIVALHRVARKQITMFCSPATSGFPHMDYFLTGSYCEPVENEQEYSEQLIRLDGPGFCLALPDSAATPTSRVTRETVGVSPHGAVFVSGANMYKITPEQMDLWARVLQACPGSSLLLYPFGPAWTAHYDAPAFRRMAQEIFTSHGLSVTRLMLAQPMPHRCDVIALLGLGDVYLDSVRHSGCVSLVDPLEIGLPPVVLEGGRLRSRQGAAILRDLGLTELIATSEDDYIRIAVQLASDPAVRQAVSQQILAQMRTSPRFLDIRRHSAEVGKMLEQLATEMQ